MLGQQEAPSVTEVNTPSCETQGGTTLSLTVVISSAKGLVGTGFASRYRLKPRTGFLKTQWVDVWPLHPLLMVDPLSYFSFQPVLHDWCNKGHGMCYPVCGMMHIKEPLLLIRNSSLCSGSRFPLSLSEYA